VDGHDAAGAALAIHAWPRQALDVGHPPDGEMIGLTGLTFDDGVAADVTGAEEDAESARCCRCGGEATSLLLLLPALSRLPTPMEAFSAAHVVGTIMRGLLP
jgi:hypothetical protein